MEFNLIENELEFIGGYQPKKRKLNWLNKKDISSYDLSLIPVLDDHGRTAGDTEAKIGFKPFRDITIELLFGDTDLARQLQLNSGDVATTRLIFTSSNTGRLMIETKTNKRIAPGGNGVDILEELLKLEKNLPPKSLEFTLSLKPFVYEDELTYNCGDEEERKLDIVGKGLKLKRNKSGSASLKLTNINLPSAKWWERWAYASKTLFTGSLSVNVKVGIAAVTELYKKRFGREPLATKVDAATDLVIFVGGNNDTENGVKCHKSILSEMSPVFSAMFQADMLEAKEGTLEIVDFSEACIRALIAFAYRGDVEEALKSSKMALDLLRVADKYEMKELMDILLYMIWSMPCSWFDVDVAVKLLLFGKNAGGYLSEAEIKGRAVLKWYVKNYPRRLVGSKDCESLSENHCDAMDYVVDELLDGDIYE